jgi:hypothetical protein
MLTYDQFLALPNNKLFGGSITTDDAEGINIDNSGKLLAWVAMKYSDNDWRIHCVRYDGDSERSIRKAIDHGVTPTMRENVMRVLPHDDKVWAAYNQ